MSEIVTDGDFETALTSSNYKSCKSMIINPIIFTITICGPFVKSNYFNFVHNLVQAWETDYFMGGGVGAQNVQINILDKTEVLSNDV